LGPGRHDRARQRAGDRRPRLAVGRVSRAPQARPMVPEDHRLRRRAAGGPGRPRPMARQGEADAGELDRQEPGPAVPLPSRRAARFNRRCGSIHDSPRHDLRSKLRGDCGRPPYRAGGRGDRSRRRGIHRRVPARRDQPLRDRGCREEGLQDRPRSRPPARPRLAAAGLHRELRADGLRNASPRSRLPRRRASRPTSKSSTRSTPTGGCRSTSRTSC